MVLSKEELIEQNGTVTLLKDLNLMQLERVMITSGSNTVIWTNDRTVFFEMTHRENMVFMIWTYWKINKKHSTLDVIRSESKEKVSPMCSTDVNPSISMNELVLATLIIPNGSIVDLNDQDIRAISFENLKDVSD